jgi:GT2 family glycosyltransferase
VGGFDVNYKNYFEDYDFIYRVREAGFHVGYIPNSHVWPNVAQSMGSESPERSRYMGRNGTLFYRQGERFPAWMFYCFLGWVSLRELIKLKFRQIHGFWLGVLDGLRWLDHGTRAM